MKRFLVIEVSGGDGEASVGGIYQTDDEVEASDFAGRLTDSSVRHAQIVGGYPDAACVIDMHDPKSFADMAKRISELDEEDEERQ